jgi:two-component system capsular synthesis sensor histidine kinase RcsC
VLTATLLITTITAFSRQFDSFLASQIELVDAQIDASTSRLVRNEGRFVRTVALYHVIQDEDEAEQKGKSLGVGLGSLLRGEAYAKDCPFAIYISKNKRVRSEHFPCLTDRSRSYWKWVISASQARPQLGLSVYVFDMAGGYLAELDGRRNPSVVDDDAYIAQRIDPVRSVLNGLDRDQLQGGRGYWIPLHYDSFEKQNVLEYAQVVFHKNRMSDVVVMRIPQMVLADQLIKLEHISRIFIVDNGSIVRVPSGTPLDANLEKELHTVVTNYTNRQMTTTRIGTTVYILRKTAERSWIWVYPLTLSQTLVGMRETGIAIAIQFLLVISAIWLMIVSFDKLVLIPINQLSRKGRESDRFVRIMVETLPVGFAVLDKKTRGIVAQNEVARSLGRAVVNGGRELSSDNRTQVGGGDVGKSKLGIPIIFDDRLFEHDFDAEPVYVTNTTFSLSSEVRCCEVIVRSARYAGADILMCSIYDITARQQAEALLRDAKLAADNANFAKSAFLATISHEIRTPLHGALGNLELLTHQHLTPAQRELVDVIQQAFDPLLVLLNNVLDFSKIEAHEFQVVTRSFDMNLLVERCIQSMLPLANKKNIRFNYRVDSRLRSSMSDDSHLRRMLLNLLHNAIKFTDMGRIEVLCRLLIEDQLWVEVEVSDTGAGISPDKLQKVFEPFVQTQNGEGGLGGTGLGLTLCRRICDLMGGGIEVMSMPGAGSTFTMRLPIRLDGSKDVCRDPSPLNSIDIVINKQRIDWPNDLVDWLAEEGARTLIIGENHIIQAAESQRLCVVIVSTCQCVSSFFESVDIVIADDGPLQPEIRNGIWFVTAYSRSAIRSAIMIAMTGKMEEPPNESGAQRFSSPNLDIRVLVADDDIVCRTLLVRQLALLGITQVDTVEDGRDAFTLASDSAYDLIITDLSMPHVDGYLLGKKLAESGISTPLVLMTANVEWQRSIDAEHVKISEVLLKPSSLGSLQQILNKLLSVDLVPHSVMTPLIDAELASELIAGVGADLSWARAALLLSDSDQLMRAVHKMAGALLVVGEEALGQRLKQFEKRCAREGCADLALTFAALETELENLIDRYSEIARLNRTGNRGGRLI